VLTVRPPSLNVTTPHHSSSFPCLRVIYPNHKSQITNHEIRWRIDGWFAEVGVAERRNLVEEHWAFNGLIGMDRASLTLLRFVLVERTSGWRRVRHLILRSAFMSIFG
jgi:hypothetical protein